MCAKLRYDGKEKTLEDFDEERNENTDEDKETRETTDKLEQKQGVYMTTKKRNMTWERKWQQT